MIEAMFWAAAVVLVYVYLGYPALMWLLARVRPRPVRRASIRPTVTLVIAAHNEAKWIARKLENSLCLRYPSDKLEIIVASDGSTDDTVRNASKYLDVRVLEFAERRGKPAVLNDAVAGSHGEIVVFSDARQIYDPDALMAAIGEAIRADPR